MYLFNRVHNTMVEANQKRKLKNILFLDIETVSCVDHYEGLSNSLKSLWDKKAANLSKNGCERASDLFSEKAAIYAEFGKVIAIGLGTVTFDERNAPTLRVKALSDHNEKTLLQTFKEVLATRFDPTTLRLCAHNGKEFDFPYLCRRMVVHGIPLPQVLDTAGKKPWEVTHLDTMEMWSFGDKKNFTSLHLLATLLGITSSKELMEGSEVGHYYYKQSALDKIAAYCMQDVVVMAQVFFKISFWEPIQPDNIIFS